MDYGTFSSCNLCFCTKYDGVYNKHASQLVQELFPDVPVPENLIFCVDCSSMLDMYRNIKILLTESENRFKQRETNELNIANFIMWSNGESNDLNEDRKCQVCSQILDYGDPKWVDNDIVSQLFPNLDSTFSSSIKLCKKCKILLNNLNSFKARYTRMKSHQPELKIDIDSKDFDYNHHINSPGSYKSDDTKDSLCSTFKDSSKFCWGAVNQQRSINYKVFLVERVQKEIKRMKRNGVYLYNCPKCEKIVIDLKQHLEEHKEICSKILLCCEICNFQNESFDEMNTHQCKTDEFGETSEKFYKCQICPFKSRQKGNLKTHSLVHKNIKEIRMFKCDKCKFQSRQKGNLKTHRLIHEPKDEIKMYKCSYCSFEAIQKGNLQTHTLKKHKNINDVALGEVLFMKCKICSFQTKQRKTFKKHMEDHNKLVSFLCNDI